MNAVLCVCACAALPALAGAWSLHADMKEFFEAQKSRVEEAFDAAVRVQEAVSGYLADAAEGDARLADPDAVLTVPSIVARHGYACETHTVRSQGYMLAVHRLPRAAAPAVLLQHGLLASSADWVLAGPGRGLAFVLHDAGYDVWMPNVRGNRYSREHAALRSDSAPFWDFSWHEVAQHDLPAVIDYVRERAGGGRVAYVGHSMGSTVLLAMLALRPQYNARLSVALALAPVAFMAHVRSPLAALAPAAVAAPHAAREFVPKASALGRMASSCDVRHVDSLVCKNVIFSICGADERQFNQTLLPAVLAHLGTGTSWKTVVHFAQEIVAGGRFQRFDYGERDNLRAYGARSPPEYDLSGVTLPIKLFWAENDLLSGEEDVRLLLEKLPPSAEEYRVPDADFNHLDYLWAIDAPTLVNKEILRTLDKVFSSQSVTLSWSWKV